MPAPYQPQNLTAEQTDGNILISWTGSLGAISYEVDRSLDNSNWVNQTAQPGTQYIDVLPGTGIVYYYRVRAINGTGNSPYSSSVVMVAAPPGEMSLGELRLRAQQTADRVNSNFVTASEWNAFIRLAMYELYDLLITCFDDYNIAPPAYINTNGALNQYELPTGTNYLGGVYNGLVGAPLPKFYKLSGVDLGVNTSNNAWVTLHRFDWIDRNAFIYPNSTSTIYGVYNMRYRVMGNNLYIIPKPAGNQQLRLWYAPILPSMLADNDLTTIGYSGWLRYPIVRAAKYALDKEEMTDTSKLDAELIFLKKRIEESAASRDMGQAETISNTRRDPVYGGGMSNDGGANGGWLLAPLGFLPISASDNIGNSLLANSELFAQLNLTYIALFIAMTYLSYLRISQLSRRIAFSRACNSTSSQINSSSFRDFITHIFKRSSKK